MVDASVSNSTAHIMQLEALSSALIAQVWSPPVADPGDRWVIGGANCTHRIYDRTQAPRSENDYRITCYSTKEPDPVLAWQIAQLLNAADRAAKEEMPRIDGED